MDAETVSRTMAQVLRYGGGYSEEELYFDRSGWVSLAQLGAVLGYTADDMLSAVADSANARRGQRFEVGTFDRVVAIRARSAQERGGGGSRDSRAASS